MFESAVVTLPRTVSNYRTIMTTTIFTATYNTGNATDVETELGGRAQGFNVVDVRVIIRTRKLHATKMEVC